MWIFLKDVLKVYMFRLSKMHISFSKFITEKLRNMKQTSCVLNKILNCRMNIIPVFKKLNFTSNPITEVKCSFVSSSGILSRTHLWP